LWEPTDQTSLRVIADYAEADENCCASVTLSASPNLGDAVNDLFPALGFQDSLEELTFNDDTEFENGSESFGISGELVHDFGFVEATLIGSYRDFAATSFQGEFNGSAQYEVTALDDDIETITAELRFQGEAFDGRLDWLVGGFWSDETIDEVFTLELGADFSSSVGQANFGSATALGGIAAAGAFLTNGNDPSVFATGVSSEGAVAENLFNQEATTLSIFTHNIFELTDRADLTVGLRFNDDTKDGSFVQPSVTNADACISSLSLAAIVGGDAERFLLSQRLEALDSYRKNLMKSLMIVNSSGRSKGIMISQTIFLYMPALRMAIRLGASTSMQPLQLAEAVLVRANLTGFWSEFTDFQVLEFTGTNFETFNVDDVRSRGFEAELNASLSDTVTLNAGLTYADAEYGEDCDDGGAIPQAVNLCGAQLTNAPEVTSVLGISYDGDFGETGWGISANVNLSQQGERRTSTNPGPADNPVDFDDQEGVTKVNARIGITMPNDQVSLEFWGLNITDEITRGITFNTPLQGASRSAFVEAPAQYVFRIR